MKLFVFHIFLGILFYAFPFISTYYGLIFILYGTYLCLNNYDPKGVLPIQCAGYILGIEVLLRMTQSILFWEFGKYAISYFFILGFYRRQKKLSLHIPMLLYFLFLLPSIIYVPTYSFSEWRQDIAFNLSGPFCLMISSLYLYNSKINLDDLINILKYAIYPILAMTIYIIMKMPVLETYRFTPYSDPVTSGGFGPNQVSTLLGFALTSLLGAKIVGKKIFIYQWLDYIVVFTILSVGLLTFSRGGMLAALIAIIFSISYYLFNDENTFKFLLKTGFMFLTLLIAWVLIAGITDGIIGQRYGIAGKAYADRLTLDLTGRAEIYAVDLGIFYDNVFSGIGPGQSATIRHQYGYKVASAHTEYSRMLAEHGLLGLISVMILLSLPIILFYRIPNKNNKLIKILFGVLAMLTMAHSAMRIAMPCFIYGLLFPIYED